MRRTTSGWVALGILIGITLWLHGFCLPALAKHGIAMGADIQADQDTVREIQKAFHGVEAALEAGDLEALMAFYSESYSNFGLTKADIKKIWADLFAKYRRFSTNHSFAKIVVSDGKNPRAHITCSGSLWGTSRETGQRESLDNWLWEVHHLVYEDRAWRLRGPGKTHMHFGVALHPLF